MESLEDNEIIKLRNCLCFGTTIAFFFFFGIFRTFPNIFFIIIVSGP